MPSLSGDLFLPHSWGPVSAWGLVSASPTWGPAPASLLRTCPCPTPGDVSLPALLGDLSLLGTCPCPLLGTCPCPTPGTCLCQPCLGTCPCLGPVPAPLLGTCPCPTPVLLQCPGQGGLYQPPGIVPKPQSCCSRWVSKLSVQLPSSTRSRHCCVWVWCLLPRNAQGFLTCPA